MAEIITRAQWGATEEEARPVMPLPARELWLHHSVTDPTDDPLADARTVQRIGIERFGYLSYSYLIHPSGIVLEGQGLRIGAHTRKRNSTSFGACLIGNYEETAPTDAQVDSFRELRDDLIGAGHLGPGVYPTGGHRDVPKSATACPGGHAHSMMAAFRAPNVPDVPPGTIVANAPFVALLAHPDGGYLQVGADGGLFSWGNAPFFGSLGDIPLNARIVDAEWTSTHQGYWLVAADGGVFAFGDARFHGSMGDRKLNRPVVAVTSTSDGGYLLAADDGGIFTMGDAKFRGNALYLGA